MTARRWVGAGLVALGAALAAVVAQGEATPSVAASTVGHAVAAEQSPDKVAHDFYAWYLGQLAKNQDPLTLKAPQLRDWVDTALLAEIDRKMHGADGLDADYFLKTQDYLDGWLEHVAVAPAKVSGQTATAVVTLGAPTAARDEIWKLRVTLASDGRRWRIRSVAKA